MVVVQQTYRNEWLGFTIFLYKRHHKKIQSNKYAFSTTPNPITLLLLAARRGVRQCTLVCPLPVILSPQCDAIVSTRAVPPFPPVSQSGPSELRGTEGRGHCLSQFSGYGVIHKRHRNIFWWKEILKLLRWRILEGRSKVNQGIEN